MSQTFSTSPGQLYLVSFWVANYNGDGPNEFLADWGATTLFDQIQLPSFTFTNMQYLVTAASASTTLQFGFRNDPYYFALDDVSVTAVRAPSFQSVAKTGGSANFTWTAMAGLAYQLQYKTNLTQANWINLGGPLAGTNGILFATDATASDPRRFYRIELLP